MNTPETHPPHYPLLSKVALTLRKVHWWAIACIVILVLTFFHGLIFQGEQIAYRDGAHFYPPLFEYIQSQWNKGQTPLWNPYDNLGQPLLANPVSSVFYPGKLIYFLPISAPLAYNFYILGHFLLAAWTSYKLARHFGCSSYAASIAAVSYVFGGAVLFQYCNVVFLVGAAWFPEALRLGDQCLKGRSLFHAICLGIVLAMMVLGGDPQMAYHVLILLAILGICYRFEEKKESLETHPMVEEWTFSHEKPTLFKTRPILISFAVLMGMAFAAVQWIPAIDFGLRGDRVLEDNPVSLWHLPMTLHRMQTDSNLSYADIRDGLLADNTDAGGITETRYRFSLSPWRLVEWVWPNASGKNFPVNTRWGVMNRQDVQVWFPSLYMGVIPFLLAFIGIRFRKCDVITRCLSWGWLIFTLGAFGPYGIGWLLNHGASFFGWSAAGFGLGDSFGGVYWFMNLTLPGYDQFRYPAKLMTVVAICMSILAARTFDQCFGLYSVSTSVFSTDFVLRQRQYRRRLIFWSQVLLVISLVLIPFVLVPEVWVKLQKTLPQHSLYGSFLPDRAIGEAVFSLLVVINCLLLMIVALRLYVKSKGANTERSGVLPPLEEQQQIHRRYFRRLGLFILAIICIDLVLANNWMIATVPGQCFEGRPISYMEIKASSYESDTPQYPVRVWRAPTITSDNPPWTPGFSEHPHGRMAEIVLWDRATLMPKYPLNHEIASIDSRGTVMFHDFYAVSQVIRNCWNHPDDMQREYHITLLDLMQVLNVSHIVVPDDSSQDSQEDESVERLTEALNLMPRNAAFLKIHSLHKRAYIETHPLFDHPVSSRSRNSYIQATTSAFSKMAQAKTIVEWDGKRMGRLPFSFGQAVMTMGNRSDDDGADQETTTTCELIRYEPTKVVLEANLEKPGFLVLADQYDPNWKARVCLQSEESCCRHNEMEVPIFRVNRVMRGVPLPEGDWEVTFYYDPMSFRIGILFSMIGWLFLGFYMIRTFLQRRASAQKQDNPSRVNM